MSKPIASLVFKLREQTQKLRTNPSLTTTMKHNTDVFLSTSDQYWQGNLKSYENAVHNTVITITHDLETKLTAIRHCVHRNAPFDMCENSSLAMFLSRLSNKIQRKYWEVDDSRSAAL